MTKIPIEILLTTNNLEKIVKEITDILNYEQTTFEYSVIEENLPSDKIHKSSIMHTNSIYDYIDNVLLEVKGYHPHVICVTDKYLNGDKYTNLFAGLDRRHGILTGKGVVTSFQVEEIMPQIPLEVYFQFYFLIQALRFLVKKEMGHPDRRCCIYDDKIFKTDLNEIMKYGTFCLECNDIIRSQITSEQMSNVRKVIGKISDIAHSKKPIETYKSVFKNRDNRETKPYPPKVNLEHPFDRAIEYIKYNDIHSAFEAISLFVKEFHFQKYQDTILLYSRLNRINSDFRNGLIHLKERDIELNNINNSLLELIREIK